MTDHGPGDAKLREEWRRRRRGLILQLHPDRGGPRGELERQLTQLDAEFARREQSLPDVPQTMGQLGDLGTRGAPGRLQPLGRVWRRRRRALKRIARAARSLPPAGFPGARRYIDLAERHESSDAGT